MNIRVSLEIYLRAVLKSIDIFFSYGGRLVLFCTNHPDVVFYGRRMRLNTSSFIKGKTASKDMK